MAANPDFEALLEEIFELHNRKNEDYAGDSNPFANFEYVARFTGLSVDKVIEVMIGIKYARLDVLLKAEGEPNFESVEDTLLDVAVYGLIRLAYRRMVSRTLAEEASQEVADEFFEGADNPMWDVDGTEPPDNPRAWEHDTDCVCPESEHEHCCPPREHNHFDTDCQCIDLCEGHKITHGLPVVPLPESLGDVVAQQVQPPTPEGPVNIPIGRLELEGLTEEQRISVEDLIAAHEADDWIVIVEDDCN